MSERLRARLGSDCGHSRPRLFAQGLVLAVWRILCTHLRPSGVGLWPLPVRPPNFRTRARVAGARGLAAWEADPEWSAASAGPKTKSWEEILSVLGDGGLCADGVETLAGALTAVVSHAERRGLQKIVLCGAYVFPSRAVLRMFPEDMRMDSFTVETIRRMIRGCIDHGLSPSTIRKGYLRVLHLAFGEAKLHSPVPQARKECKHLMSYAPPSMPWFEPEQIRDILHRIRNFRYNRALPSRDRDANLVALIAYTGIRPGELSRVKAQDVDLERRVLHVRHAKVRNRPRDIPLRGRGLDAARWLVRGLEGQETFVTARVLNGLFETWKVRLGEPHLNARALRHSYATGLLLTGNAVSLQDARWVPSVGEA